MSALAVFSSQLERSPLSLAVQTHSWVIPTTQSIHILALSIIMVSVAMLDLRLVGLFGRGDSLRLSVGRFIPAIWYALPVSAATGAVLIVGEPARELLSPFFWAKMILLALAIIVTFAAQRLLADRSLRETPLPHRMLVQGAGFVSLGLWLGIIFCGRWIAYG